MEEMDFKRRQELRRQKREEMRLEAERSGMFMLHVEEGIWQKVSTKTRRHRGRHKDWLTKRELTQK
uniref:Uncharacterized protein n=1 Tax=Labrus bergylta TaxID=56723 RepID=A0A3Q3NQL1_9LABR